MNEAHEFCGSDEWRQTIRDVILPWALGETDLGDDVLEVGPGYGATTDVLGTVAARVTSVEIDDELAAMLRQRFAATPSIEIVNGDATPRLRRWKVHRRSMFHDAASCPDRRTAGPTVR